MIHDEITGATALCLLIGDPVSHSLSPRVHNASYAALRLNLCMAASRVRAEDLANAIAGVRALSLRGLAVTMPHKVALCPLLDAIDPVAATIGAVNTVVNDGGRLIGYNTDWLGIVRPLEKRIILSGKRIAVLGAGGAALAAIYGCMQSGASVTILNRTSDKARKLAAHFGAAWGELDAAAAMSEFDVIINTTPVGMGEQVDQIPIASHQLAPHHVVLETIYAPRQTALLRHALSTGCTVINGAEMFLEQAAAQFELHTGVTAPRVTMEQALKFP